MRERRVWVVYAMIVLFLLASMLVFALTPEKTQYEFSVDSTRDLGFKAAKMLLEEYGFAVEVIDKDAFTDAQDTLLWIEPLLYEYDLSVYIKNLPNWLSQGNTLIIMGDPQLLLNRLIELHPQDGAIKAMKREYERFASFSETAYELTYQKGFMRVIGPSYDFCNNGMRESGNATRMIHQLWPFRDRTLVINQAGRSLSRPPAEADTAQKAAQESLVGREWIVLISLCIVLFFLAVWIRTKRFGPPWPAKIPIEPDENYEIIALGRMMQTAGLMQDSLEMVYQQFSIELKRYLKCGAVEPKALEQIWQAHDLPALDKLQYVHRYLGKDQRSSRALSLAFIYMDDLRGELLKWSKKH